MSVSSVRNAVFQATDEVGTGAALSATARCSIWPDSDLSSGESITAGTEPPRRWRRLLSANVAVYVVADLSCESSGSSSSSSSSCKRDRCGMMTEGAGADESRIPVTFSGSAVHVAESKRRGDVNASLLAGRLVARGGDKIAE